MAKYVDKPLWEEEVLIPDTSTPVLGGQPVWEQDQFIDGFYNVPIAILADRTRHLKNRIDGVEQEVTEGLEGFLIAEENLADLTDVDQAKYNLGLNLVDNTTDANKPVSVATQAALDTKVDKEAGKGLSTNDYTNEEKNKLDSIEEGAEVNVVISVAGKTGTVTVTKADVGLGNVDNTSDSAKPISTATQAALNNKVDIVAGKGLSTEDFTTVEKNKLSGVAEGATANQTDAFLRNRSNHTGTQAISTVSGLSAALDEKVDKVTGFGLSQENFTSAEKSKLAGIEGSHYRGLFSSFAALTSGVTSPVAGDYADVDDGVGSAVERYIWDVSDSEWVKQSGEVSPVTASQVKTLYESNPDTNAFTDSEKSKLTGIAAGATANTGTVTSINVAVPTGLQVSGGPITNSGTITVSYASGYAIPTTTKQGQWDTAYGWGNHSTAGYALSSSLAPVATSGNWADVANKPAVMAVGATQQEARDAIGAGTSDLQIGTTASTAKAGNYSPTSATKANVLQGSSSSVFVTPASYFNVISWATASPSGTVTLDLDSSLNHDLTVSGSVTMASPSNADVGKTGDIVIRMTANGTVSWNTNWKFLGSVPDIGQSGEMWVISYKVLSGTEILASANKVAS